MLKNKIEGLTKKIRLDNYLTEFLNINRSSVNKLVEQQLVKVNGEIIIKNGFRLSNGDEVKVEEKEKKLNDGKLVFTNIPLEILHEDNDLIVINKPKHILVHPTSFSETDTVVNALVNKISIDEFEDKLRPGIVHRLDKNTTGLMVIAKNAKTADNLMAQIRKKILIRKYLALVHTNFQDNYLLVKLPIDRNKHNTLKMVISDDSKAKEAITEIKVLENYHTSALIECRLLTGRTHQIRIHLSYIHHPVFNDPLYGNYDGFKDYDQFLHAHELSFTHPVTKKQMIFKKEPDKIFMNLKQTLRGKK
jgi:23S rRNA pseudouridine1911/1915/1917 synthase